MADSQWLVGLLVVGGLLFAAFSSNSQGAPAAKAKRTMAFGEEEIREEFLETYAQISSFLRAAATNSVPSGVHYELDGISTNMRSEILVQADEVGTKLSFAICWLAIARQSPEAQHSATAEKLMLIAGGHLSKAIANQLRQEGLEAEARPRALQAAAKEIGRYKLAAVEAAKAFAASRNHPMDSLYNLVETELPLGHRTPEEREKFYGPKIREQWGRPERRPRTNPQPASKSQVDALEALANSIPKLDERYELMEKLYNSLCNQWSEFFSSSVVDRLGRLSRSDMDHMRKFSEMAAISMSFANLMLFIKGEQARYKDEDRNIDASVARVLATQRLSKQIKHTLDTGPALLTKDQKHPDVLRSMAMKKLEAYELAVIESMSRYSKQTEFPFDPLFVAIDKEARYNLPDPKAREDFFGIKFREELGRLVRNREP